MIIEFLLNINIVVVDIVAFVLAEYTIAQFVVVKDSCNVDCNIVAVPISRVGILVELSVVDRDWFVFVLFLHRNWKYPESMLLELPFFGVVVVVVGFFFLVASVVVVGLGNGVGLGAFVMGNSVGFVVVLFQREELAGQKREKREEECLVGVVRLGEGLMKMEKKRGKKMVWLQEKKRKFEWGVEVEKMEKENKVRTWKEMEDL